MIGGHEYEFKEFNEAAALIADTNEARTKGVKGDSKPLFRTATLRDSESSFMVANFGFEIKNLSQVAAKVDSCQFCKNQVCG